MYRIKITQRTRREFKKIQKRHQHAIAAIIEELKEEPFIGKPLKRELTGRYSYRVGLYRVIYKINEKDKVIVVLTAGHRAKVYKG